MKKPKFSIRSFLFKKKKELIKLSDDEGQGSKDEEEIMGMNEDNSN